jgi:hypothetical protein
MVEIAYFSRRDVSTRTSHGVSTVNNNQQENVVVMQKWEHIIWFFEMEKGDDAFETSLEMENRANELGNEGWELIGLASYRRDGLMVAFKRQAQ